MADLKRRLIVSFISIILLGSIIFFAHNPWLQYLVILSVALLAAIAIWEYEQFAKAKGGNMIFPALVSLTTLEVISFFFSSSYPESAICKSLPAVIFFIGFLILFSLHFRQKDGAVVDLAISFFGLLYIAVPVGMILGILYFPFPEHSQDGRLWVAYLLTVTKITDVGAYFAGKLWGRRKLAPKISPGKTVEGALFGLLCAVSASYAFHLISEASGLIRLGTTEWLSLGLILGLTGQFGDLSESLLKRDANKKDSNALPGLGGILDALDSLLFNAPIIYFYLTYFRN